MITLETIQQLFNECLPVAIAYSPLKSWAVQPTIIKLDTHKSNYGQALSNGDILINPAFLGTTAHNKLKATILHELAHLIVGLEKGHNIDFRYVETILCEGLNVDEMEKQAVKDNNGFKLRLLAFGEKNIFDLGGAFRRTKRYTTYGAQGNNRRMSLKGEKLIKFEYVPYSNPLPEGTVTELTF